MSPDQISFAALLPTADEVGTLFYQRLFALDPSLRRLFKGDIAEQSRSLMRMIAVAVNGLDRLDTRTGCQSARRAACRLRRGGCALRDRRRSAVEPPTVVQGRHRRAEPVADADDRGCGKRPRSPRHAYRLSKRSACGMPVTAWRMRITGSSAQRCYGPWRSDSATALARKQPRHGAQPTGF